MPGVETIAAIAFIIVFSIILYLERKRITVQKIFFPFLYFIMIKTKLGLNLMDRWAKKYSRLLDILAALAIIIGYLGMLLITFFLVKNLFDILTKPEAVAGVALVLPFKAPGAVYVPFFYWILSIFFLAVIHEFSHGVLARRYNVKVKSSGFAALAILLPILPAAFVEPDEQQVAKLPKKQQIAIFAAGPFSNIVVALVIIALFIWVLPSLTNNIMLEDNIKIVSVVEPQSPALEAGLEQGKLITEINGQEILNVNDFITGLADKKPQDIITLTTNESSYDITLSPHPNNASNAFLGVSIIQNTKKNPDFIAKYGSFTTEAIIWFLGLLYWLYVLNLGIGLFNLVPMGPIDGGRMLHTALTQFMSEKKANFWWKHISYAILFLILANIAVAFI
ncbi:MAG: site-2 protease family protein [Candidatus Woesearchaeota archaeon]|nr:site-2 protease family protein [Candidatus Woesearchaeota archaeon]